MFEEELGELLSRGVPFNHPLATSFEYSTLGYAILGMVVASVAGQLVAKFATYRLFQPLEMPNSVWGAADMPDRSRAHGYRPAARNRRGEPPLTRGPSRRSSTRAMQRAARLGPAPRRPAQRRPCRGAATA